MILLDRYVMMLKRGRCPITGKEGPLVMQSGMDQMKHKRVERTLNEEDFYIWVVQGRGDPVYISNFDIDSVPFSYQSPGWKEVLNWGLEIAEILDCGGVWVMHRYIDSMPDPLWDWVFYLATNKDAETEFRKNFISYVIPEHNVTCGSVFAQMQAKRVKQVLDCDAFGFVKAAGPSVAFCAAEWVSQLDSLGRKKALEITRGSYGTWKSLTSEIFRLKLHEPRYMYNTVMTRKWLEAVSLLLQS